MQILTINVGSSSLRAAIYSQQFEMVWTEHYAAQAQECSQRLFADLAGRRDFLVIVHRFVHGGAKLQSPAVVTADVLAELERCVALAPLHNGPALEVIKCCATKFADVEQVVVFDTAFFADLPEVARTYALPHELCEQFGLRRFGFHGLAHQSMYAQWQAVGAGNASSRCISFQLGSGCSAALIENGKPLDTSMGFSPLEGLVMGTRCGDIDSGILLWLQEEAGFSAAALREMLTYRSGLLGVSGASAKISDLLADTSAQAQLAVELYCRRIRKYLGSYLVLGEQPRAILFGGGVGENVWQVREKVLENLEWQGIVLDRELNQQVGNLPARISQSGSAVGVWVIAVDEQVILAREAFDKVRV